MREYQNNDLDFIYNKQDYIHFDAKNVTIFLQKLQHVVHQCDSIQSNHKESHLVMLGHIKTRTSHWMLLKIWYNKWNQDSIENQEFSRETLVFEEQ